MKTSPLLLSVLILIVTAFAYGCDAQGCTHAACASSMDTASSGVIGTFLKNSGLYGLFTHYTSFFDATVGRVVVLICMIVLLYLAIAAKYEPLYLIPFAFGGIVANIPSGGMAEHMTFWMHAYGSAWLAFWVVAVAAGIGASVNVGALVREPRLLLVGLASKSGLLAALTVGALVASVVPGDMSLKTLVGMVSIGSGDIITAAFGIKTTIAPNYVGSAFVLLYLSVVFLPRIQAVFVQKMVDTERFVDAAVAPQDAPKSHKFAFLFALLLATSLIAPKALPMISGFVLGNLIKQSGAIDALSNDVKTVFYRIAVVVFGFSVGLGTLSFFVTGWPTVIMFVTLLAAYVAGSVIVLLMVKFVSKKGHIAIHPVASLASTVSIPTTYRLLKRINIQDDAHDMIIAQSEAVRTAGFIGSMLIVGILLSCIS